MMRKVSSLLSITVLLTTLSACHKGPAATAIPEAVDAAHYPADTMCYLAARKSALITDWPQFEQFKRELFHTADLSAEESALVEQFLQSIDSISIGIGKISLSPLTIEAGGMLAAEFSAEQIRFLKSFYADSLELTETDPIHGHTVYSRTFAPPAKAATGPLANTSGELFLTLPKDGKIAIAADRQQLEFMLNAPTARTNALAADAGFTRMLSVLDNGPQDTISFVRTQSYFDTLFGLISQIAQEATKNKPIPISMDTVLNTLKTNMRLQDWGNSISTWDTDKKYGISKMEIKQDNPLYQQLTSKTKMVLPHVPVNASQVLVFNLNNAEKGFNDFAGMINNCAKLAIPPAMGEPIALAEASAGFKFSDLAAHLSGPISFWQHADPEHPEKAQICFCLGLKDETAFKSFLSSIPAIAQRGVPESDGIYSMGPTAAWAVKNHAFYIASSTDYLKRSLDPASANLFDSAELNELLQQAGSQFNTLQYTDYTSSLGPSFRQLAVHTRNNPLLSAYLNLFKNIKLLQTGTAKDGMFVSETFLKY